MDDSVQNSRVPAVVLFEEALAPPESLAAGIDLEELKARGWTPLRKEGGWAWVATCREDSAQVIREAAELLKVGSVSLSKADEATVRRFIEHAQDVNPGFPPVAGRTSLARTRTFLAAVRSQLSSYRSLLSKGRTGLAMLRTGLALITVSLVLVKVFGTGLALIPEAVLAVCGGILVVDGLIWYIPARRLARRRPLRAPAPPGPDITVPVARLEDERIAITRTPPVPGAGGWVKDCERHSPVMRRRFLALERTELAMERTRQAYFRTVMSKSRTGMALVRTGISLCGLGIAFLRRLHAQPADAAGLFLMAVGVVLTLEGLSWYLAGHGAGKTSLDEAERAGEKGGAWGMLLPPAHEEHDDRRYRCVPLVAPGCSPGIWGSTGLALERTLLAERRNVMSRFRTSLACSRTGMAYVRTGVNFVAVGLGLLLTGPGHGLAWVVLESVIMAVGVLLLADGLYWHLPARRDRWQLPFCDCEMEIAVPDYSLPPGQWKTFELGNDR
ncbi:hypothetical protein [Fundidesulfovibrio terrae]|uniref:hypothetical protein n=1 Tax=Fundidesulfovibrio terrae TaxID=2922866 RepID=UPI001FAF00D2|nr:hypothetical protein [Fundidesulfovibrio terrae]